MDLPTQRFKLTVAYRGTAYHGWQHQTVPATWKGPIPKGSRGLPTIQETLTRALMHVVGHPVTVVGASRTDAGVHAKGQVAHFDTRHLSFPPERMRRALNHQLPPDILVRKIEPVPREFLDDPKVQADIQEALDRARRGDTSPGMSPEDLEALADEQLRQIRRMED